MPTRKAPVTQGVDRDLGEARAWSSIEFKMKMADYEGVTISAGMSQVVNNSRLAIRRMHRQQAEDLEAMISQKVTHLREVWEEL